MFQKIKNQAISGAIFVLPMIAIAIILKKMWGEVSTFSHHLALRFGIHTFLGAATIDIITVLFLLLLSLFFGWLVQFNRIDLINARLDNFAIKTIPGYATFKFRIQENIENRNEKRPIVSVDFGDYQSMGWLIEQNETTSVVFFPGTPDYNSGNFYSVKNEIVKTLNLSDEFFEALIQRKGKGMIQLLEDPK